jgi:hypothetical protein
VPTAITSRNARFQQLQALLTNRTKRQRAGEFLVQGIRPITMAVEHGLPTRALVHPTAGVRSQWATGDAANAATVVLYEAARQRGFTTPGGTDPHT